LEHKRKIEIDEIIKNAEENKLIDSEINWINFGRPVF
jgi:hypothetical protein